MALTDCGQHEALKLTVHGAILGLSVLCLSYNVVAYYRRREGHLARNAVIYTTLAAFELVVMAHHCDTP